MNNIEPTFVIRHRKENLQKCSLRGLELRSDFCFYRYPLKSIPPTENYVLLSLNATEELSSHDASRGLLILDATWRYAQIMEKTISFPHSMIKRRLPKSLRTAYPRRQNDPAGLASIEAIAAAYMILGRDISGILDHYYWKEAFLEKNTQLLIKYGYESFGTLPSK